MPIDAGIYSQIQQPQQIAPPANPLLSLAQAYQIKNAQRKGEQDDLEFSQTNELARLYQGATSADGQIDRNKLIFGAAEKGLGAKIPALQKGFSEQDKASREAEKAQIETFLSKHDLVSRFMGGVTDQQSLDAVRPQIAKIVGPEAAANMPTVYDPRVIEQARIQAMSVKDQLETKWKGLTFGETQRHNQAMEGIATQGQDVTRRGQDLTRQSATDRLNHDKDAPKGQVVQTEQGVMLVDPRTGVAQPVTSNGVPVQRPAKEIPATMSKAIIENQQSIAKIDRAIAEIDKNPDALGTRHMFPFMETIAQYTDPEGVEARAGVADIGSLVLHDRSGAAVTVSETPRLKPFIPSASDKPEVAKKKLARFKEIYEEEAGLLGQTYSKSQGYRESPVLESNGRTGSAPAAAGPVARIAQAARPVAGGAEPPAAAIAYLKANPGMRAQFEAKYGKSAAGYLGQ